jgi:hypothetical protein
MAIRLGRSGVVLLAIAGLVPTSARAQSGVARNFDELHGRVLLGETVKVVNKDGEATRGKLLRLTDTDLTVRVDGQYSTLAGADIVEVKARRSGPLWNGALIGAAVPVTLFGIAWASYDGGDCSGCAPVLLLWSGIGAGIGVGIDALVKGDITVMRTDAAGRKKIAFAPLVQKNKKGVLCSIRF